MRQSLCQRRASGVADFVPPDVETDDMLFFWCVLQPAQELVQFILRQLPEARCFFCLAGAFAVHKLVVVLSQVYVRRELLCGAEHKAQVVFEVHVVFEVQLLIGVREEEGTRVPSVKGGDVAWRLAQDADTRKETQRLLEGKRNGQLGRRLQRDSGGFKIGEAANFGSSNYSWCSASCHGP